MLGILSCSKVEEGKDIGKNESSNFPLQSEIMWHVFDESSMVVGDEVYAKLYKEMFNMDVFIIIHPDSTSIGVLQYDSPAAEVFRVRIAAEAANPTKKPVACITEDKETFFFWKNKMEKEGRIVVYVILDGSYYGLAYTKEEWDELNKPKNN